MKETKEIVHDAIENAITKENAQETLPNRALNVKPLKNIPMPYSWLLYKKHCLWNGFIRGTFFALLIIHIAFFITRDWHSLTVNVVTFLAAFCWLANLFININFVLAIKAFYNENEEECMETLRKLFPNAVKNK